MAALIDFTRVEGSLPRTEGVLNLSPDEARGYLELGAILLDLREPYETNFRVFDVENIIYLPWSRFEDHRGSLPRDEALVVADASGIYAKEAIRILRGSGFENLANLVGGMIDWDRSGLPVRRDSEYELRGQCACKLKSRHGGNPLMEKQRPG
jgi:rhodanese-related sulfurtransferase